MNWIHYGFTKNQKRILPAVNCFWKKAGKLGLIRTKRFRFERKHKDERFYGIINIGILYSLDSAYIFGWLECLQKSMESGCIGKSVKRIRQNHRRIRNGMFPDGKWCCMDEQFFWCHTDALTHQQKNGIRIKST